MRPDSPSSRIRRIALELDGMGFGTLANELLQIDQELSSAFGCNAHHASPRGPWDIISHNPGPDHSPKVTCSGTKALTKDKH